MVGFLWNKESIDNVYVVKFRGECIGLWIGEYIWEEMYEE